MRERDDIARAFHNIYLVTAKAFKWLVRPDVDVPFEELSKDAQALDYALADFHLSEIASLRDEFQAELDCGLHEEHKLVWCVECIKIDRAKAEAKVRAAKELLEQIAPSV